MNSTIWRGKFPEIDEKPLMGSPIPILSIFAVYLWVVLKAGPEFMKDRKAFKLTAVTRIYNMYQLIGSVGFVYTGITIAELSFKSGWECVPTLKAGDEVSIVNLLFFEGYWYYILFRISEFLETIIFVLRKKQSQASFLHVHHHLSVVAILWLQLKYSAGRSETFIMLLNSSVHVVMYAYYFFSSFKNMRGLTNRMKPFLTRLQITQLFLMLAHCARVMLACEVTRVYYFTTANIVFLVVLFIKFYYDTYKSKNTKND